MDTDVLFKALVDYFDSAKKNLKYYYDWDDSGENGTLNREGELIDYDEIFGTGTDIVFVVNAYIVGKRHKGDYDTPDYWEILDESVEVDIEAVNYLKEDYELSNEQKSVLSDLIVKNIKIS